jgi:hypothetical protein
MFVLVGSNRRVGLEEGQNGGRVVCGENVGVGLSHRDMLAEPEDESKGVSESQNVRKEEGLYRQISDVSPG